ncbi:MAG: HAMP domain-containing histidine kinase [Candidatus Campbellbacteria bacterium]|nr:HAMP domain-containing histidine kinase [Candidatus Campbellbacteria bacterium]
MEMLLCLDSTANFLGLFDTTIAPTLLYYAYLPIAIFSVFFGFFIFFKNPKQIHSRLLLALSLTFASLILNEVVTWIAVRADFVHFGWEMSAFFQVTLVFLVVYFTWTYLKKSSLNINQNGVLLLLYAPVIALLPSRFNMVAFDLINCEGINGPLWYYIYALEFFAIAFVGYLGIHYFRKTAEGEFKKQIVMLSVASVFFLSIFTATNVAGDIFSVYEVNLIGPIGMVLFIAFLAYMMVKFHAFNTRIIGTQMLVIALGVLVFAMLFVRRIENVRYVIIATLGLVTAVGTALIKSVKQEVRLREETQKLAKSLEFANVRQLETLRFITHEVKGYLTDASAGFDAIATESFGPVAPDIKAISIEALRRTQEGVTEVKNFLHVSDFKTGQVTYAMQNLSLKELLMKGIEDMKRRAETKKLALALDIPEGDEYTISGDADYIFNHVLKNLIDNAINYTPEGSVTVSLAHKDGKIIFSVKDSGVGLTDEDKAVLFTEGGRGKDSRITNVHSTGYGLFIAKQIVTAHNGRIWAESKGRGKGSTFLVEFPGV